MSQHLANSVKEAIRLFGDNMSDAGKFDMVHRRLNSLLRDSPARSYSFDEAAEALDLPEGQEYASILQSAILRLSEKGKLMFNSSKSKFQYKPKLGEG